MQTRLMAEQIAADQARIRELAEENKRLCFRVAMLEGARDIARREAVAAEAARDRAIAENARLREANADLADMLKPVE